RRLPHDAGLRRRSCALLPDGRLLRLPRRHRRRRQSPSLSRSGARGHGGRNAARAARGRSVSEGSALKDRYDLVVIGAGPAGLAAATEAARLGLDTVLLDEQGSPGGQIYRAVTATPLREKALLGDDYWQGAALVESFRRCGAAYVPGATVW